MAGPVTKRRKVEHVSSDDESDDASFVSFGPDGQNGMDIEQLDGDPSESDVEIENGDAGSDESSEEDDEDEDERGVEGEQSEDTIGAGQTIANGSASAKAAQRAPEQKAKARAGKATDMGVQAYMAGSSRSNVFRLQIDDLLEQIRPRRGAKETAAEKALHTLKTTIENIASKGPQPVLEAERKLLQSKIATPFPSPRPPKEAKYKLEYAKPSNINVVGSHATKTASRAKGICEVDMVLTMPSDVFQEKDFLDHRYFYKRAYYLACVAAGVKAAHGKDFSLQYRHFHDNPLKPILVVSPGDGTNEDQAPAKWRINIIPGLAADVFPVNKLRPDRCCIRSPDAAEGTQQSNDPTPFYNSSVRSDMLSLAYLKLTHAASKKCAAYQDACLLAGTWLRQRGLDSSFHAGGIGTFELSAIIALLLQDGGPGGRPMLSDNYSSYQLFKATLQLFAVKDMSKQHFILGTDDGVVKSLAPGSPIFWDAARGHNLLYKMPTWSYKLLRQEARTTLSMLGNENIVSFEAAFILRLDSPMYRHDYVLELDAASLVSGKMSGVGGVQDAQQVLYGILRQGLGDRVNLINVLPSAFKPWGLGQAGLNDIGDSKTTIGFTINPETVNRTVDRGPSAEDKTGTAAFRKFWGEKAELRRFKDGSIQESLLWPPKEGGQSVLEQIIRYLVLKQFGPQAEQGVSMQGDGFKRMLPQGSGTSTFQPLIDAYKQLELDIRSLDALPLSVRQIMAADPQTRYASISPPSLARRPMPADVSIQFEASGRWPDDLVAIQRTKIAFLLKLSDLLLDAKDNLTCRIGLENETCDVLNQGFLDIMYNSGAAFRLRIHHDREQTLFERQLKDKSLAPSVKETAALGLAQFKRTHLKAPAHTQAVARLCTRHPALSGAIRLTKKWFASHLLSNQIPETLIELFVLRTFVSPWPWQTPSSTQTGFLRTLFWLSRWDWRADPLIVDLSAGGNELQQKDIQAITARFEAWRKLDPALNRVVLFAASNVDHDGTTWTDGRPAKVVAGRMTALARAACAELEAKQLAVEPAALFESPLEDFDFVLHLNPEMIGKKTKSKKGGKETAFKNLELEALSDASLAGFDPVTDFVHELEGLYGTAMLLFSGGHEKAVLAGLWSPLTKERPWKVNLAYSTVPKKGKGEEEVVAEIDREGILKEMVRLGGGMVDRVTVNGL